MSVRLAAIGFQHQHIFHLLDNLLKRPGVELVALAEWDEALRRRASARYSVTAYAAYAELLARERPDVAVLAPVNSAKPEVIAACALAGAHVYTDKPMATTHEGLDQIASAVQARGTLLYMAAEGGYGLTAVWKSLIDSGELGRPVQFVDLSPHRLHLRPDAGWTRPAWSYERAENGGIIVDLAVHGVNTWRYLSGQEVAQVSAVHGNVRFPEHPGLEDHASVFLTMTDGSTACLMPSWLTPGLEPSHGRGATYLIGSEGQLEVTSPGIAHGLEGDAGGLVALIASGRSAPRRLDLSKETLTGPEDDFLAAIAEKRQPRISAEFLIESQRIALLARDAADQRRTIQVRG